MNPAGGEAEVIVSLLQYGILGILVIALFVGWVVPKHVNDRDRARADRLEAENAALRDRLEKDVIPLLTRAVLAFEQRAGDRSREG